MELENTESLPQRTWRDKEPAEGDEWFKSHLPRRYLLEVAKFDPVFVRNSEEHKLT